MTSRDGRDGSIVGEGTLSSISDFQLCVGKSDEGVAESSGAEYSAVVRCLSRSLSIERIRLDWLPVGVSSRDGRDGSIAGEGILSSISDFQLNPGIEAVLLPVRCC